jgi:trans-2,3-dihydro-3-hydroxyanthranilate isomerase
LGSTSTARRSAGGACGPLGAYLLRHGAVAGDPASPLVKLQGVQPGRASRIDISLKRQDGRLEEVWIGGEAVVVGGGTLSIRAPLP